MPTIEENIDRIATALEALVQLAANPITTTTNVTISDPKAADQAGATAVKAAAGKDKDKSTKPPAKPAPAPAPEPEPAHEPDPAPEPDPLDEAPPAEVFTLDQVRAALKAYRDVEGAAAMMDILKQNGADTLGELKAEKYASVMAAVK